jgi:hypothetical protein
MAGRVCLTESMRNIRTVGAYALSDQLKDTSPKTLKALGLDGHRSA